VLTPDDEHEWQNVVEQSHDEEGDPDRAPARHSLSEQTKREQQNHRGHKNPKPNQSEGRQLPHSHAVEEERATPGERKADQEDPFAGAHWKRFHAACVLRHSNTLLLVEVS
jgi:hypothetical protein